MKVRTTVTLPKDLLMQLDALAGKRNGRSAIVVSALTEYVAKSKLKSDTRVKKLSESDIDIINRNADKLNEEALDVLEYQQLKW